LQPLDDRRFTLHQLLRQYAQEHLTNAGEIPEIRNRHLAFFVAYAEGDAPTRVREPAWLEQIAAEAENLWVALHWSATGGDVEAGLQLAFSLHVYWERRGYWREEQEWLTRLLARPTGGSPTLMRARVLTHAGRSALHLVDSVTAASYYTESLTIARQHQSTPDIVLALLGLGDSQQDHTTAQTLYAESLALSQECGFPAGAARAMACLGHLASGAGNYADATALYQKALVIQQELGDQLAATGLLRDLGIGAFAQQAYQQAQAVYEECLRTYRTLGHQPGVVAVLNDLADVALVYGDYAKAKRLYGESLTRACELGSKWNIAWSLESLARVAAQEGQYECDAYLFSHAEYLFQHISARLRLDDRTEHERIVATVRTHLCAQTFATAWRQGQSASLERAVAFALYSTDSTASVSYAGF
jgi:tetratricopeptide (TPR) repeat protein